MDPTFSVVIPTYGRPEFLDEAVASVLAQTDPDLECLVVDDAGPEPVAVPDDPRVRVVRRDRNGGPAAARNSGIAAARGRYIAFLDDDDLWTPDRLAIAREGLAAAPVVICHSRHLDAGAGRDRDLAGEVHDVILDDTTPHCGATVVARDAVVPFDERFAACEDLDWWLRLTDGAPVVTVGRLGLLVRRHGGVRHGTGTDARITGSELLLEVHAPYFASHPRAAAFRWRRIGHLRAAAGDRRGARSAYVRSLRRRPSLRTLAGWARTWRAGAQR